MKMVFLLAALSIVYMIPSQICLAADSTAARREAQMNSSESCKKMPMRADGIVRLSFIEVYPEYLSEYLKFATEVGEISLKTEPGVLTMYSLAQKDNPCKITILETYSSQDAYNRHIASEHFQKYKQGTLKMVKTLNLVDQSPINPANTLINFIAANNGL